MEDIDVNIERLFREDSIEKKRIGRGSFAMKGKGKKHGMSGIIFPSDYLSKKERNKLNGVVKVSNIYDDIQNVPSVKEIKDMEFQKASDLLILLKTKFTNKQLMNHWGMRSSSSLHVFYAKFKATPKTNPNMKKSTKWDSKRLEEQQEVTTTQTTTEQVSMFDVNELYKQLNQEIEKIRALQVDNKGFNISVNGEFEKEEGTTRILNILQTLMDGKKYNIKLEIKEL